MAIGSACQSSHEASATKVTEVHQFVLGRRSAGLPASLSKDELNDQESWFDELTTNVHNSLDQPLLVLQAEGLEACFLVQLT